MVGMARYGCPGPEEWSAYIDGRLSLVEVDSFVAHAADCDDCRRELVLTASAPVEEALPDRDLQECLRTSVLRSLERQRITVRRHRSVRARPRNASAVLLAAAAALLLSILTAAILFRPQPVIPPSPVEIARERIRNSPPIETPPRPEPSEPEIVPSERRDSPEIADRREPGRQESARPPSTPQPLADPPKPREAAPEPNRETRPEKEPEPPRRVFASVPISDVSGVIQVRRRGSSSKERIAGVAEVGEGDVLSTERSSGIFLLGSYAVALVPQTELTLAAVRGEDRPAITVMKGEAVVDSSTGTGSAWLVGGTSFHLSLDPTRGQFAIGADSRAVSLLSLNGPLSGRDDFGREFRLAPGERLTASRHRLDRHEDAAAASRQSAFLAANRPGERSIVHITFDGTSLKAVKDVVGDILRDRRGNDHLRSTEEKDVSVATVTFRRDVLYQRGLRLRIKLCTTLTAVRVSLLLDERGTVRFDLKLDRRQLGQWVTFEVPVDEGALDKPAWVRPGDKIVSVTVLGHRQDVFGDVRILLLDDVQILAPAR